MPASARRRTESVLLRYRDRDGRFAVTRRTATRLARHLGLTETQVIHLALAELAARNLPSYPRDEGALPAKTIAAIRRRVPQRRFEATEQLF